VLINGAEMRSNSLAVSIAVNVVPFLLSVIFIRIRTQTAERFSGGSVTGSSSLCGTGLIA